jgi:hypothetical protein
MQKVWARIKKPFIRLRSRWRAYIAKRPHRSFRKTKPPRTLPPLVGIRQNTIDSLKTMWQERRLLLVLSLFYIIATYTFVGAIAQADFVNLKDATLDVLGGNFNSASTVFSLFTSTMTGAFNTSLTEVQQLLAMLLAVLFWLAIIWALRMRFAKKTIKARDALYNSAAPLISYLFLGFFIILQLSPGAVGAGIFALGQSGGYFQGGVEVMAFAAVAVLLVCLSLYWLAGSLVALVVVTLPQMYPWRALQIASELAWYRRTRLLGHTLNIGLTIFLLWLAGLLPALLIDAWLRFDWLPLVPIMVQFLGAVTIVYLATYVYRLYRSML